MITPQQKGETIAALAQYDGQVDRARRYLGLSKREMKARAKEVFEELPVAVADKIGKEYGFMAQTLHSGESISIGEVHRRLQALIEHEWNVKAAAKTLGLTDSTLYYFINRPKTRKYAEDNGIEIPARFGTKNVKTIIPGVEVIVKPLTPDEISSVLIKALEATTAIHEQTKDGLLAMQETLTIATEKAISEVFHIVRQYRTDNDVSHL